MSGGMPGNSHSKESWNTPGGHPGIVSSSPSCRAAVHFCCRLRLKVAEVREFYRLWPGMGARRHNRFFAGGCGPEGCVNTRTLASEQSSLVGGEQCIASPILLSCV